MNCFKFSFASLDSPSKYLAIDESSTPLQQQMSPNEQNNVLSSEAEESSDRLVLMYESQERHHTPHDTATGTVDSHSPSATPVVSPPPYNSNTSSCQYYNMPSGASVQSSSGVRPPASVTPSEGIPSTSPSPQHTLSSKRSAPDEPVSYFKTPNKKQCLVQGLTPKKVSIKILQI